MDYIDKQIYQVCKTITREYSIVKNETMRHNREYPQVIDYNQLERYFFDGYPNLYSTMVEYHDEISGTLINKKLNLVLTYESYQESLSLKLPILQTEVYRDDDLFLIIVPRHRVVSVRDDNTGQPLRFIDCRFGNLARNTFTETENKAYHQKHKKLQKYYNMTRSKYDQHYTLEKKRLRMSRSLYENYKKLLPSESALQKQSLLISRLNDMLNDIWPNRKYKILPFGSSVTDLMLNESDIDLSIVLPDIQHRIWEYANEAKHQPWGSVFNIDFIASQLKLRGMKDVEAIHAIVPICKFKDPITKLNCDLSICNNLAIENSNLIATYLKLDDRIRPLLYLIKYFTKKRHINKSISGTLSSYAYVLLFLSYLMKVHPTPIIPNLQNLPVKCELSTCIYHGAKNGKMKKFLYREEIKKYDVSYHNCIVVKNEIRDILNGKNSHPTSTSSTTTSSSASSSYSTRSSIKSVTEWESYNSTDFATILIEFFEYYSTMDFNRYAIALSESGIIPREKENRRRKDSIVIKDPFIKPRNVATTCTEIGLETIQKEFKRAYNILTNGGTWKEVCSRPDLRKRPIDPHSVENKKSNVNSDMANYINDLKDQIDAWSMFDLSSPDYLNSLKHELKNALSTVKQQKSSNSYHLANNHNNHNNHVNNKNHNNRNNHIDLNGSNKYSYYNNMEPNDHEGLYGYDDFLSASPKISTANNNNNFYEEEEEDDDVAFIGYAVPVSETDDYYDEGDDDEEENVATTIKNETNYHYSGFMELVSNLEKDNFENTKTNGTSAKKNQDNIPFVGYAVQTSSPPQNNNNNNNKEKEKVLYNDSNGIGDDDDDDEEFLLYLRLKDVPEYIEEEDIISGFCIYGYIVEMEKLDGKATKKDKYYSYYNWNIRLNAYDFLPPYFMIDSEIIYYESQ
ncbi:unnamed protein product [Cunninghamella blakesleeana]